jgi:hypothetical protein
VVVIDDRSQDGTAEVARSLAKNCGAEDRLTVISGAPLPSGWVGKVWALAQGIHVLGAASIGMWKVLMPRVLHLAVHFPSIFC